MTSAAVAAWTTSIPALEQLFSQTEADDRTSWRACKVVIHKLVHQPPLTRAVWRKLAQEVKVARKLAALCVHAQQQHAAPHLLYTVQAVFNHWMLRAQDFLKASPTSSTASTLRQHLQASGIVQQQAATLSGAQQQLDAAAAAAAAAAGTAADAAATQAALKALSKALQYADVALRNYFTICQVVDSVSCDLELSWQAALPAAPAALGLVASVFQAGSVVLQQHAAAGTAAPPRVQMYDFQVFEAAQEVLRVFAAAVRGGENGGNDIDMTLEQLPGGRELLLSPELVRWLAVGMVAALLGLDTSLDPSSEVKHSSSSSNSSSNSSSSSRSVEQPGSGVSLDSLTPLSLSLFDLLKVDKATVIVAGQRDEKSTLKYFSVLKQAYKGVLAYQVDQVTGGRPVSGQLLLHLEVDLLLTLFVHQAAASIPASHTAATAATALMQTFECWPLMCFRSVSDLHRMPMTEPYTGPQLALQLWPSPLPPKQHQQHSSEQHQQQQPEQEHKPELHYVLAPTAALLSELLPLLTGWCLKRLLVVHKRRKEQQQQLGGSAAGDTAPAGSGVQQLHPAAAAASLVGGYGPASSCPCIPCAPEAAHATWSAMRGCLNQLYALLKSCVVPDPVAAKAGAAEAGAARAGNEAETEAETEAVARTEAGAPPVHSTAESPAGTASNTDSYGCRYSSPYSCVLHAQDAILPHAGSIIWVLEGLLRESAVQAAAAPAAGSQAPEFLQHVANIIPTLCHHGPTNEGRAYSPVVMAVLAAGPGSQVQQQLFSLFASIAKVTAWDVLRDVLQEPKRSEGAVKFDNQEALRWVAAAGADAVLAAAADTQQQQQQQQPDGQAAAAAARQPNTPGHAAAVHLVPCLMILGRCYRCWAQRLQQYIPMLMQQQPPNQAQQELELKSVIEQLDVAPVLPWLESGDVSAQLAAAGYAPEQLMQQFQRMGRASEVLAANARNKQPDEAAFLEAVEAFEAAGVALSSIAAPCVCNNPCCLCLSGPTELGLVSGRSCVCAGCLVARYHDRACQRAHWKQHKPVCAVLKAAAAAIAP